MIQPAIYLKRIGPVIGNALVQSVPVLFNFILSWIVIRYYGSSWWGDIVELQLAMYLAGSVCAWGNKEFLLREFSHHPSGIRSLWKRSFTSRALFILVPVCILLLCLFPLSVSLHLSAWVLLRFTAQSFDSVVTYHRAFYRGLWAEGFAIAVMLGGFLLIPRMSFTGVLSLITISQAARVFFFGVLFSKYVLPGNWRMPDISVITGSFNFALLAMAGFMHTKSDMFCVVNLLDESEIAFYQVFTAFLLFVQSVSAFMFQPYLKNFYRFRREQVRKAHFAMMKIGMICSLAAMPFIYIVMKYWYGFQLSPALVVTGILYAYMPYTYLPAVYLLYKMKRSWWVIGANLAGVVSLIVMYWVAFRYLEKSLENTLLVATINHFIMALGIIGIAAMFNREKEAAL